MSASTRVRHCVCVAAVFCTIAGASACTDTKGPPVSPKTDADTAEQTGFGVRTLLTTNGVQKGELQADTMFVFNDQTKFDFRNARVKFNTETGTPNGTMRADRGIYDTRTQVLEGFGNVVITTLDGKVLKSPHVKFNQLGNEVTSDTTFEARAGDRTQSGIGFTADPNLTHVKCLRMCRGSAPIALPGT
ncbi:MAG TPA: LPS export ABC transporter periplasmic protein LptC [Gemmatimonadaceae bacterium]|nr:LPS export ABC transporter periplasmic protein LptC [Gemmatimonadaceae bacterium]